MRDPRDVLPVEVDDLLRSTDAKARGDAWERVVAKFSRLILRVTHKALKQRDDAMDAYVFVLDHLVADDYRRIRTYAADGRCKFTTWLVVVTQRAGQDFVRHKYGRKSETNGKTPVDSDDVRRQLAREMNLVVDPATVPDENGAAPDAAIRAQQLLQILKEAISELPIEDRLLLKLKYGDDLPASAIARFLGWSSPFDVYHRLDFLKKLLRYKLRLRGVDERNP